MNAWIHDDREWLETDGLGGFASGTASGIRTRRYHALLMVATRPPVGRFVLVNGFDAWVESPAGTIPISTQQYSHDVLWPEGYHRLIDFSADPWPTWQFSITNDVTICQESFVPQNLTGVALRWSVRGNRSGLRLHLRPLLSGRDYHSLHHENPNFCFESRSVDANAIVWQPYTDLPAVYAESNAAFEQRPDWYRHFVYQQEQKRGLDDSEDLASPGEFHWDLERENAVLLLSTGNRFSQLAGDPDAPPLRVFSYAALGERKFRSATNRMTRSAYSYFANRQIDRPLTHTRPANEETPSKAAVAGGLTILAGFPWFTDWGRDTFIAMRGLCMQSDRLEMARQILLGWSHTVSEGMLPNRFPDYGDEPEYNSVDASLWFIIAVYDYLQAMNRNDQPVPECDRNLLTSAVIEILTGYSRGTRFGIRLTEDGLLAAGEPGVQLTWMDAKVGDWVVTPRIGKPVEVQALWLNALWIAVQLERDVCLPAAAHVGSCDMNGPSGLIGNWSEILAQGRASFNQRFWNHHANCLYDVVDVNHVVGSVDDSFRPNQILAVGGLPLQILEDSRARLVVDAVESRLLTPIGLRSLDPSHPDYRPRYCGGVLERDGSYHQGTVWPWLIGPFVEAWVRVRGGSDMSKHEARRRFVDSLLDHLNQAGIGHISEIADAEPPHTPRGCPFQAWSLGELLRLTEQVLHVAPIPVESEQHVLWQPSTDNGRQTDGAIECGHLLQGRDST